MSPLAVTFLVLLAAGEPPANSTAAPTAAPPAVAKLPPGNPLLGAAAAALERHATISARLRQTTDMHGRQLVGVGTYLQQQGKIEVISRLSLKIQVDRHVTSMQQIVDDRFLWERRDLPGRVSLTRIDLKRVRAAIAADAAATGKSFPAPLGWGGLPRMLRELDGHFDFAAPAQAQLAQTPVVRLEGAWNLGALAALVPAQKSAIAKGGPQLEKLPDHLPGRVVLFLGANDQFPHRIEYHRVEKGAGEGEPPTRPILILEFFDVEFDRPLDPLQFTYKPDGQEVLDTTEEFLKRLQLTPPPQAARPTTKK